MHCHQQRPAIFSFIFPCLFKIFLQIFLVIALSARRKKNKASSGTLFGTPEKSQENLIIPLYIPAEV
jgi:hypothetical protein